MVNRLRLSPLAALRAKHLGAKPHPLAIASFGALAGLFLIGLALQFFGDPHGGNPHISMTFELDEMDYDSLLRLAQGTESRPMVIHGTAQTGPQTADAHNSTEDADGDTIRVTALGIERRPTLNAGSGPIRLRPAPAAGLFTEGQHGIIPAIGPNGDRPADIYARPYNHADGRPRVALVIGGLGLNRDATQAAIETLPGEVTLSFVPYAENLQRWINLARDHGHEVIIELPMEPYDYPDNDPGPATLLTSNEWDENASRLDWVMSRATGYIGIMNYQGARLSAHEESFTPVLREIANHGLAYLDDGTSQRSLTRRLGSTTGGSWAIANRRIDLRPSRTNIDAALLDLEATAVGDGVAIGVGFAYPITVEQIVSWAGTLEAKGLSLAPLSAVTQSETS